MYFQEGLEKYEQKSNGVIIKSDFTILLISTLTLIIYGHRLFGQQQQQQILYNFYSGFDQSP